MLSEDRILVTGGAGFIGSHVVELLRKKYPNSQIVVLDNMVHGHTGNLEGIDNIEVINEDLVDYSAVKKAMDGVNVIFHLAAQPFIPTCYQNPEIFITSNINGVFNLVKAFKDQIIKSFVHISTSEVYGTAQYIPIDERHALSPHSTYAASKVAAENIIFTLHKEQNFPLAIVRPFNTYGPRDTHPRIIPEIITQFSKSNILNLGNIEATRDFTYVEDIAKGIVLAAEKQIANGEKINICSCNEISMRELISTIAKLMNREEYKINISKTRLRPLDVDRLFGYNAKSKRLLDWEPKHSLKEGLKKTIDWYKEKGPWIWETNRTKSNGNKEEKLPSDKECKN